jgi:hypothetical protein
MQSYGVIEPLDQVMRELADHVPMRSTATERIRSALASEARDDQAERSSC